MSNPELTNEKCMRMILDEWRRSNQLQRQMISETRKLLAEALGCSRPDDADANETR